MDSAADGTPDEWRRFVMLFELSGNTDAANVYSTSIDIVNITNGQVDSSWIDADLTTVVTNLHNFLSVVYMPKTPTALRHIRTDVYRMAFAPIVPDPPAGQRPANPFMLSGPPTNTYTGVGAGSAAGPMQAPQIAATTTDRTAYPKHWGRNYWPMPSANYIAGAGNLTAAFVDSVGGGLHTCYAQLMTQEFFPVVTVTRINKAPGRGLLGVTEVQMDDVPDVVRRRRPKDATHYYLSPVSRRGPVWTPDQAGQELPDEGAAAAEPGAVTAGELK